MIWDAIRYGYSTHYWLTIAGVPVVWGEAASGLSLPSGFSTEDPGLVIDGSAELGTEQIDRVRGISVGLSLSFKLLDTATSKDWLRTWSKSMTLTADQAANVTTATVDDSTGWSNGDTMFLAMENQTIGTVASGTSLTGITRSVAESLAYDHKTGTTAQIITDRPRVWRGRQVVLWASPVDPSGFVTGATLATDAVQVWKGKLIASPRRDPDGFAFEATSLDRLLDERLVGEVTGKAIDSGFKYEINQSWRWLLNIDGTDSTGAAVWSYELEGTPFDSDADGDLLSGDAIRDRITTSMANAVTAESAGADLGDFEWLGKGKAKVGKLEIVADNNIVNITSELRLDGLITPITRSADHINGMSVTANTWHDTGWLGSGDPLVPIFPSDPVADLHLVSLTVELDQGDVADVPNTGKLTIGDEHWSFKQSGSSEAYLYLGGLQRIGTGEINKDTAIGESVSVLFEDTGTPDDLMRRCLMTSGTTGSQRSATYDTLNRGQGYGIDEDDINDDSFTDAGSPITTLACELSHAGKSFADLFGGALGLFRRAVVLRPDLDDGHNLKLTMVRTSPYGSVFTTKITDNDLLSAQSDPIISAKTAEAANVITVLRPLPGSDDRSDRMVFNDGASADIVGTIEASYEIPATDRDKLLRLGRHAATSLLASDQSQQAVEFRVGPWIDAWPGDIVYFNGVTHPSIWTFGATLGAVGYTGNALIVGRRIDPVSTAVILTALLDGALGVLSLSPSAPVSAHVGLATDPDSIDVPRKYHSHFAQAIDEAGSNIWLYHYKPGESEVTTEQYDVSAATDTGVGGVCRLTIDSTGGAFSVVDGSSHVTLPTSEGGDATAYQLRFAHVDDGTHWG